MTRRQPHEFDPRRSGVNTGGRRDYEAGYQAGRAGGVPPGRKGCRPPAMVVLLVALVPFGVAAAGWGAGVLVGLAAVVFALPDVLPGGERR